MIEKRRLAPSAFAALALSTGLAFACEGTTEAAATVVEVVEFRLVDASRDKDFAAAARALEASFLCGAPGYVSRTLTRGEDGVWLDMVHWTTLDDALAAAEAIMADPGADEFMRAIDPDSIRMSHRAIMSSTR